MIIGVIGSGGREHALCSKILESKKVTKVYCFPGNAGTNLIATNVEIKIINNFLGYLGSIEISALSMKLTIGRCFNSSIFAIRLSLYPFSRKSPTPIELPRSCSSFPLVEINTATDNNEPKIEAA